MLGLFGRVVGCVPAWSDVSVGHAFSDMVLDVFLSWSYVSVGRAILI